MNTTIILPDIHDRSEKAEKILQSNKWDLAIILGDEFDSWQGTEKDAEKTAEWVKFSINQSNRIHIWGNHTIGYRFPSNTWLTCSGFTYKKCKVINSILTKEDWDKFKLFYYHQDFYISHAGISPYVFSHPLNGINPEHIQQCCDEAIKACEANLYSQYVGVGKARGGWSDYGGITWLDLREEFEPIDNVNQIFGHTICKMPLEIPGKNSSNLCLDTNLNHYAILENEKFSCHEV